VTGLLVVAAAVVTGLGLCGLMSSVRVDLGRDRRGAGQSGRGQNPALIGAAIGAGLVAGLITRWPTAVPIAAVSVVICARLIRDQGVKTTAARIEAIAVWTELLRDTLVASAGLNQAIVASEQVAPAAIRSEVAALAARVASGYPLANALRLFAEELADPGADLVVCALVLAAESRTQRLSELLTSLADSIREDVSMRLRVDASRSATRSGVKTIVLFSLGFMVLLALVSRAYLAPFSTLQGQAVLVAVVALYGTGVWLMARLARFEAPVRLLASETSR
jgi:Flp pilus assembly protein TadB